MAKTCQAIDEEIEQEQDDVIFGHRRKGKM